MNKGLNIFLAVLLCVVVYIGLLLSFYSSKNVETSNPYLGDVRPTRGTYGTYAVSVGANSMGSDMAAISVRSANSMFRHRPVFSYAPAQSAPAYSQSPIANRQSPIANRQGLYTTSSATMKSFGGGTNGAVSMSSGVVSSNATSSPTNFVSMSSNLPSPLAYYPQSTTSFDGAQLTFAASSLQEIGASAVSYGASAPRGISGRRNASSMGGNLDDWIQGLINEYGWLYSDGEIDYFDKQILENLYKNAIANGELPEGVSWEMFLSWFGNQSDRYAFPIPSGVWFMCFLALGYGLYIAYRRKQKVVNS